MLAYDYDMKSLLLRMTLFVLCIFLYTANVAVGWETNYNKSTVSVVSINPRIRVGQPAHLLLILPGKDSSKASWDLYLKDSKKPYQSGQLSDQLSIVPVQCSFDSSGTYSALLIARDANGAITSLESEKLEVRPSLLWEFLPMVAGPIIGAFMAILVFLVNDHVKKIREDAHLRESLKARILREIDKFISELDTKDLFSDFPLWLLEPTNPLWSYHFDSEPFQSLINSLHEIHQKRNIGLLQDRNSLRAELLVLKKTLAE